VSWLHVVLDLPGHDHGRGGDFWAQALGWPLGRPWPGHPELRSFAAPDADSYVHLQQVAGPAGVHLDLESQDAEATVERARQLGADHVGRQDRWTTMRSPGGLPFCVLEAAARRAPDPVRWPQGHLSRLVQVCIDSPVDRHPGEVAFWRDLLLGRWVDSPAAVFAGKWHDDAVSPVQLLFQRLDEETGQVRAHLDLGTDDIRQECERLQDLGATDVGPGRGWHTMRDPVGLLFCATGNDPHQTPGRDLD
jgi:hypothetical protein